MPGAPRHPRCRGHSPTENLCLQRPQDTELRSPWCHLDHRPGLTTPRAEGPGPQGQRPGWRGQRGPLTESRKQPCSRSRWGRYFGAGREAGAGVREAAPAPGEAGLSCHRSPAPHCTRRKGARAPLPTNTHCLQPEHCDPALPGNPSLPQDQVRWARDQPRLHAQEGWCPGPALHLRPEGMRGLAGVQGPRGGPRKVPRVAIVPDPPLGV